MYIVWEDNIDLYLDDAREELINRMYENGEVEEPITQDADGQMMINFDYENDIDGEIEVSEDDVYNLANEYMELELEDDAYQIQEAIPTKEVFVVEDIGRWNGRVPGMHSLDTDNFVEWVKFATQEVNGFVRFNDEGTLEVGGSHHDGTNYYTAFILNADEDEIYGFIEQHENANDLVKMMLAEGLIVNIPNPFN